MVLLFSPRRRENKEGQKEKGRKMKSSSGETDRKEEGETKGRRNEEERGGKGWKRWAASRKLAERGGRPKLYDVKK